MNCKYTGIKIKSPMDLPEQDNSVPVETGVREYFDSILNTYVSSVTGDVRGVCIKCGRVQTHSLVYCKKCGNKFYTPKHKLTIFDIMKIVRHSKGKEIESYRPEYQAAIFKRKLRERGYTEKQFIEYCNYRLNQA